MSNIERIEGSRWATELCRASLSSLELAGGHERLVKTLRLGLIEKPADYMAGVIGVIRIVEDAGIIKSLQQRHE